MSTLLLRLEGPLQSWGYRSRFSNRDTGLEPSKSGVIGLLCCALGRDRSESPSDLASLAMHIRVDRQGSLLKDYHTAGGGTFRGSRDYFAPKSDGGVGKHTVETDRYYLQDASFLVALEGEEALLSKLAEAVKDPCWPLALGRRSCPPSTAVYHSYLDVPAEGALVAAPMTSGDFLSPAKKQSVSAPKVRFLFELPKGDTNGEVRRDVPVRWLESTDRQYTVRYIREEYRSMEVLA